MVKRNSKRQSAESDKDGWNEVPCCRPFLAIAHALGCNRPPGETKVKDVEKGSRSNINEGHASVTDEEESDRLLDDRKEESRGRRGEGDVGVGRGNNHEEKSAAQGEDDQAERAQTSRVTAVDATMLPTNRLMTSTSSTATAAIGSSVDGPAPITRSEKGKKSEDEAKSQNGIDNIDNTSRSNAQSNAFVDDPDSQESPIDVRSHSPTGSNQPKKDDNMESAEPIPEHVPSSEVYFDAFDQPVPILTDTERNLQMGYQM